MRKIVLFLSVFYLTHARAQLSIQGDSLISVRGTWVLLGRQGFPEQIDSLLAENVHFHFTRQSDGKDIKLTSGGLRFTRRDEQGAGWEVSNTSDELRMDVSASLQGDGNLHYTMTVTALQNLDLKDITLHIPLQPEKAKFMTVLEWNNGPASARIGAENGGIQYSFKSQGRNNERKEGTTVVIKGKSMLVNNYSGPMNIQKGKSLRYDLGLLITH